MSTSERYDVPPLRQAIEAFRLSVALLLIFGGSLAFFIRFTAVLFWSLRNGGEGLFSLFAGQ